MLVEKVAEYCHPRYYKGLPNQLFLNQGNGTFKDVSKEWGIRDHIGKGMGVAWPTTTPMASLTSSSPTTPGTTFSSITSATNYEEVAFQTKRRPR